MERKYLKWFIAVLVGGIVVGFVLNIYYDLEARRDMTGLLQELFSSASAGDARKFASRSYIRDAYIFGDLDPPEVSARENGLSELYAEIVSGGLTLQSVSFVKIVERLAALTSIKVTDSKGAQQELHLILIKETDREKKERWLPYRLLNPQRRRKEVVTCAKSLLDADATGKEVKESVLSAVSSVDVRRERAFASVVGLLSAPDEIMAQVRMQAESLAPLVPDEVIRKEFLESLKDGGANPTDAFKSLFAPQSRFRSFVARLKAISDANPDEAQATAEKLTAAARQLEGRVDRLLGTIQFCAKSDQDRLSEVIKKIAGLISEFVPAERRSAFDKKLEEAAGKPEVDLKTFFAEVKEAASSPAEIFQEKVQAVAVVVRKRSIPPEAKEEFLNRLGDLAKSAGFEKVAEELASLQTSEQRMRYSFLLGLSGPDNLIGEAIALQSTQDYLQEIVKMAKHETAVTTSSILAALEFDSSAPADIYAELVSDVRDAMRRVKDCAVLPERNQRKQTEAFVRSLPAKWAGIKTEEEFLKWAFPEGVSGNSAVAGEAKNFFAGINGKEIEIANVHQWYDRYRTCALVIVRVLLDSDKHKKAQEEYERAEVRYEEAKKGCDQTRKKWKDLEKRLNKGEKECEEAKENYEQMQREHKEAKENYEEAQRGYRESEKKREYAVISLLLIQRISPDWSVAWTLARSSSARYEDYKMAAGSIYDEEMKRREEILSSSQSQ